MLFCLINEPGICEWPFKRWRRMRVICSHVQSAPKKVNLNPDICLSEGVQDLSLPPFSGLKQRQVDFIWAALTRPKPQRAWRTWPWRRRRIRQRPVLVFKRHLHTQIQQLLKFPFSHGAPQRNYVDNWRKPAMGVYREALQAVGQYIRQTAVSHCVFWIMVVMAEHCLVEH